MSNRVHKKLLLRNKKQKSKSNRLERLPPKHKCYGYWTDFCDKVKAIEEKDLAEMEAEGDKAIIQMVYRQKHHY